MGAEGFTSPNKDKQMLRAVFLIGAGRALLYDGQLEESKQKFLQAKTIMDKFAPTQHSLWLQLWFGLGAVTMSEKQYGEAET